MWTYIDPDQYGSIPGTSTTHALMHILHQGNNFVRVLLLDYSRTFHHLNHLILLEKLLEMGVPPTLVRWMVTFLQDRSHLFKIGDVL